MSQVQGNWFGFDDSVDEVKNPKNFGVLRGGPIFDPVQNLKKVT